MERLNKFNKETAKIELIQQIQNFSEKIKNLNFFKNLESKELSFENYSTYFSHKYSTVGYFTSFLKKGAEIGTEENLPNIKSAFQNNYEDESGIINGKYEKEWEHETWRQTMLKVLNVKEIKNKNPEYSQMIDSLMKEKNIYFMSGYLTLIELFVAIEMKNLWKSMNRDLSPELTKYSEEDIPFNSFEYIKNHADHDGDHYSEILDASMSDMKNSKDKENFQNGVSFAYKTRELLYKHLNNVSLKKKNDVWKQKTAKTANKISISNPATFLSMRR